MQLVGIAIKVIVKLPRINQASMKTNFDSLAINSMCDKPLLFI